MDSYKHFLSFAQECVTLPPYPQSNLNDKDK